VNFQLLIHAPEDVAIVRAAPWWTAQRLTLALGGTGTLLAMALAWSWLLRRQVEQRIAQLAKEIRARRQAAVEFDAVLGERERVAADLHDTLEQSLTGLALQLEASEALHFDAPERSARHLALARQLVTRSREDVRRSIWNLRSQSLENRTLPEALRDTVARMTEGRPLRIEVESEGAARVLSDLVAGNLLLLAREAMTNAVKHGGARNIRVRVVYQASRVELIVEDDGRGFDLANRPGPRDGHFGLQGMHERMKRLGGTLEIQSTPAGGTRIAAAASIAA
jgi:signal transduction histidine kinase